MRVPEDESAVVVELRRLINEWDPIGVYDPETNSPDDEYDCLYHTLLGRLERGESAWGIAEFLRNDLENHFGLNRNAADPGGFAERLVAWWASRT